MSITYGFYNSIGGDRKADATDISKIFDGIIRDGMFMSIGTSMIVSATSEMGIKVGVGRGWFNHTWTYNDAELPMTVNGSEVFLNRIDAVVLEINATNPVRENSIKFISGTPSSSPVRPTMIKTDFINQYPLCFISIKKGVTAITQADITNMVGTSDCPFVTGILSTMNIDALIAQWGAQWDAWVLATQTANTAWTETQHSDFRTWSTDQKAEYDEYIANFKTSSASDFTTWFNSIKDQLGADAAGNLLNLLNNKILTTTDQPVNQSTDDLWFEIL